MYPWRIFHAYNQGEVDDVHVGVGFLNSLGRDGCIMKVVGLDAVLGGWMGSLNNALWEGVVRRGLRERRERRRSRSESESSPGHGRNLCAKDEVSSIRIQRSYRLVALNLHTRHIGTALSKYQRIVLTTNILSVLSCCATRPTLSTGVLLVAHRPPLPSWLTRYGYRYCYCQRRAEPHLRHVLSSRWFYHTGASSSF